MASGRRGLVVNYRCETAAGGPPSCLSFSRRRNQVALSSTLADPTSSSSKPVRTSTQVATRSPCFARFGPTTPKHRARDWALRSIRPKSSRSIRPADSSSVPRQRDEPEPVAFARGYEALVDGLAVKLKGPGHVLASLDQVRTDSFKSRTRASQRDLLRGLRSIVVRSLADRERGSVAGVFDGRRVRPGFETAKEDPAGGVGPEVRRPGRRERPFGPDQRDGSIGERFALWIDEFEVRRLTRRGNLQDDRRRTLIRREPQLDRLRKPDPVSRRLHQVSARYQVVEPKTAVEPRRKLVAQNAIEDPSPNAVKDFFRETGLARKMK